MGFEEELRDFVPGVVMVWNRLPAAGERAWAAGKSQRGFAQMKRVVIFVVALMFVASLAQAAAVDTKAGTKAMVFQFSGLNQLGANAYQGGIGMRYYLSDGMAIRPGLAIGVNSDKIKGTGGNSDDKTTDMSLGLSAVLEKHVSGPANISPYMGAGVGFKYGSHKHEPSYPSNPGAGTVLKTTTTSTGVNLFGALGFEWGFAESLTLGGEYRFGFDFGSGKTETEYQSQPTVKSGEATNFGIGFSTASVYLSVGW
jgi:opacity protein-like surface antigen